MISVIVIVKNQQSDIGFEIAQHFYSLVIAYGE